MQSVTHRGLVGQTTFRPALFTTDAATITVTVAGVTAPFTLAANRIIITTPLVADADVVIAHIRDEIITLAQTTSAGAMAVASAANASRRYAKVFNDGATVKRFAVDSAASSTVGIPVAPGTGYEWPVAPKERITVFCTAAESYQLEVG